MTPIFVHLDGRGHMPLQAQDHWEAVALFADQLASGHSIEEVCDFMRAWASGDVQ